MANQEIKMSAIRDTDGTSAGSITFGPCGGFYRLL